MWFGVIGDFIAALLVVGGGIWLARWLSRRTGRKIGTSGILLLLIGVLYFLMRHVSLWATF
jgi:hypothetical protein